MKKVKDFFKELCSIFVFAIACGCFFLLPSTSGKQNFSLFANDRNDYDFTIKNKIDNEVVAMSEDSYQVENHEEYDNIQVSNRNMLAQTVFSLKPSFDKVGYYDELKCYLVDKSNERTYFCGIVTNNEDSLNINFPKQHGNFELKVFSLNTNQEIKKILFNISEKKLDDSFDELGYALKGLYQYFSSSI